MGLDLYSYKEICLTMRSLMQRTVSPKSLDDSSPLYYKFLLLMN